MMKITKIAACAAMIAGVSFSGSKALAAAPEVQAKPIELNNFDNAVKPGNDFFRYSNGGWMKNNPIPDEYSRWGAFGILDEQNNHNLLVLLEAAAKNPGKKGTVNQKIGDFYNLAMDTNRIEKEGIAPLKPFLADIDKISNLNDVILEVAKMHTQGIFPLFFVYSGQDEKNSSMVITQLAQGGLGMSNRDYYTDDNARAIELRKKYVEHVASMYNIMNNADGSKFSQEIMDLETKLAKTSLTIVEQRDPKVTYNKMSLAELEKLCPNINWKSYFNQIGLKNPGDINVSSIKFFTGISSILQETPIEVWKEYLRWHLLHEAAPYLSAKFVEENFNFYGKALSGSKKMLPRWKRAINATNGALGEAVGKLYAEKYFPAEAKNRMVKLVENLRSALKDRITNLDWMSAPTKAKALEKLAAINVKIGYPDKWRSYDKLSISLKKSYFENIVDANVFDFKFMMDKIGKKVDRSEWGMTPQTVNAYYSPNMNEIVFPAAILQPPFFFLKGDDAINYGGIGGVIGHEMTHGFDDQGRQYDKEGNLNDWWTPEDAKNFEAKTQVLINQFNHFKIDGDTVNGEQTLGENIADLGGITVAYTALQKALKGNPKAGEKIDGFTQDQRFLLSWSQVWRTNVRPEEAKRRLKEDVHSPAEARVNALMPNVPLFYKAFDVKPGDILYRPENERAIIW